MDEFEYTYSAPEQEEIKKIRDKYVPREESKLEQLRRLDAGVTQKGTRIAITLGVISALVFGTGMSCCLVWADTLLLPGIAIGILGVLGISMAYPVYTAVTRKERQRVAPEILRLTEELLK